MTDPLKTAPRTVIQIISEHLQSIGADGLVQPDAECGCELDDLVPCCRDFASCAPGYKGKSLDDDYDWTMYASKEAAERSKVDGGEQP